MNTQDPAISEPEGERAFSLLYVEDEPVSRVFLGRIITMKYPAMQVHAAENGQCGLDLFRKVRPDVVLTDISMPVMDGIRMAREIRLLRPDAAIIAMSAHSSFESRAEDFATLFTRYIAKPINSKELFAAIDECLVRISGAGSSV